MLVLKRKFEGKRKLLYLTSIIVIVLFLAATVNSILGENEVAHSIATETSIMDKYSFSEETYVEAQTFSNKIVLYVSIGSYSIEEYGKEYCTVKAKGLPYYYNPGEPVVPYVKLLVLVPQDAENFAVSIEVLKTNTVALSKPLKIALPLQPDTVGETVDLPSVSVESKDEVPGLLYKMFPEQWLGPYKLLPIALYLFQYSTRDNKLTIYEQVRVEVSFKTELKIIVERPSTELIKNMLNRFAVNPSGVRRYYKKLLTNLSKQSSDNYPFVIITSENLAPLYEDLASLRSSLGYRAKIVTVEWIQDNFPGNSIQDKIRNFITYAYENWGTEYVILGGDYDVVPPAYFYMEDCPYSEEEGGGLPYPYKATDLYYALLYEDWDPDDDGKLLECLDLDDDDIPETCVEQLTDFMPEVYVGRIPTYIAGSTLAIITKLIRYEKNIITGSWLYKWLLAAAISKYENEDDKGYPKTDDAAALEAVREDFLCPYTYIRLYEDEGLDPSIYPHEAPLTYDNYNYYYSSYGVYVVIEMGHGSPTKHWRKVWSYDDGDGVPESSEMEWYEYADTHLNLENGGKTPITYVSACLLGKFDDLDYEAYGEYLVQDEYGAIVSIASSRISYYTVGWVRGEDGNQGLVYLFAKYLTDPNTRRVSEAFYGSKVEFGLNFVDYSYTYVYAGLKDFLEYIFFGDPLTTLWRYPRNINVQHPSTLTGNTFTVKVTYADTGDPVEGATVTVYSQDFSTYVVTQTNSLGEAEITLATTPTTDKLNITVSGWDTAGHNLVPYDGVINVSAAGVKKSIILDGYNTGGWRDLYLAEIGRDQENLTLKLKWYGAKPDLLYPATGLETVAYGREFSIYIDKDFNETTGYNGYEIRIDVLVWMDYVTGSIYEYDPSSGWVHKSDIPIVETYETENGLTIGYLGVKIPLTSLNLDPASYSRIVLIDIWSYFDDYLGYSAWISKTPATINVDGDPGDWATVPAVSYVDEGDEIPDANYQEFNVTAVYALWGNNMLYHRIDLGDIFDESKYSQDTIDTFVAFVVEYSVDGDTSPDITVYYYPREALIWNITSGKGIRVRLGEGYQSVWYGTKYVELGIDTSYLNVSASTTEIYVVFDVFWGDVEDELLYLGKYIVYPPESIGEDLLTTFNAEQYSAYFVYADPYRMEYAISGYDVSAGGIIYGLCSNSQHNIFDYQALSGNGDQPETLVMNLENTIALTFGGPIPNWFVRYYEYNEIAPVKFRDTGTRFEFIDIRTGAVLAYLDQPIDFEHEEMFIIEAFKDVEKNITVIIFYGFGWKGTWGSSIYMHYLIKQGLLETLTNDICVFHWYDSNNNGIPEPEEISQVYPP
ncbi:MAG: hypothetical protein B6U76_08335 [Desulfurococcales archaeon ex4484_217_2]|nr:MAG: hypothetical protein B6U76_08335 [Desulfurococcales archaeon ex4484_217_2]